MVRIARMARMGLEVWGGGDPVSRSGNLVSKIEDLAYRRSRRTCAQEIPGSRKQVHHARV
jgi:hypothetical protein